MSSIFERALAAGLRSLTGDALKVVTDAKQKIERFEKGVNEALKELGEIETGESHAEEEKPQAQGK